MTTNSSNQGHPPSLPEIKRSRDGRDTDNEKKSSSASSKPKSKSRRGRSKSSHRSSSSSKEEGRRSFSPHSSPNSPNKSRRRSSHSRSSKSNTTPDSKTAAKEKTRRLATSPGVTYVASSSRHRRHGKGSKSSKSSRSGGGSRHSTPSSSTRSNGNKLKLMDAYGTCISAPPLVHSTTPGARQESGSSAGGRSRKSPKLDRTTEATAAPDIAEIEAAALQRGREEGERNARKQNRSWVASPSSDDNADAEGTNEKKLSRKYVAIGFIALLAFAGGIIAWQLVPSLSSNDEDVTTANAFVSPSEEDCLAISKGQEVEGQDETRSKTIGAEIDLAVAANSDLDLLQRELESKMQQDILPLLAGCDTESNVVIENNNFLIDNVVLKSISADVLAECRLNPEGLCSTVYMEMEVFSFKSNDVDDESVLKQIKDVFLDKGVLDLLKLASPVEDIGSATSVYKFEPSLSLVPTSSPSTMEGDIIMDEDDTGRCEAIRNGESLDEKNDLASQSYDVLLDVVVLESDPQLTLMTVDLENKLQRIVVPSLAGCDDDQDSLIITGKADADVVLNDECLPDSGTFCHRFEIHLEIFMEGTVATGDFLPTIREEFLQSSLMERLSLVSPFERIDFVDVLAQARSTNPSSNPTTEAPSSMPTTIPSQSPSSKPSFMPVVEPTLEPSLLPTMPPTPQPTPGPTLFPTRQPATPPPTPLPTPFPTPGPTPLPTPGPTPLPTPGRTPFPTSGPTPFPTPGPTSFPTSGPTLFPSLQPTSSPTKPCIATNSDLFAARDSWFGTSSEKATVENAYGLIGDWCFDSGVTSMRELFRDRPTFNEDISNWDTSAVTDMMWMFYRARSFNQDISKWNTSAVTNMRSMFNKAYVFNQDISNWDTSAVTVMAHMFWRTNAFNQDISNWDTSAVTNMEYMFYVTTSFNQDISNWDTSSVTRMARMFFAASSFNQNLCAWGPRLSGNVDVDRMFLDATQCPSTTNPNLSANPRGPFCHVC
ncbi:unnamed protein product [Cylindrotheca closterium]|uniref:BspA family leucine-rich repeat surface protein n=1 Tax=Cylindrotheca closterium TaxID=2856 RepID=A0AAD2G2Q3_9STRA|nr:unnamed protein product [Cylindrotheca closterium]